MKIAYLCFDEGGCAYYRSILPIETLAKKEDLTVLHVGKGAKSQDYDLLVHADIIQLGRFMAGGKMRESLADLQRLGAKLVLEYDDNVFAVDPYSPHYKDYGLEEYIDPMTGIEVWKDGVGGFSIAGNKARLNAIEEAAKMVDMITVTQPNLAEVFRKYNDNVVCLPNCVDPALWQKLPLYRQDPKEVRLFWQGGCSHYIDWLHLMDVLPVIFKKYPFCKLVVMGQLYDGTLNGVPKDRIEYHKWVHFEAYPLKVATLDPDIALIPLDDNEFNRCKSNIKWVEMSAMGVPAVVSAVSPYREHYNGKNMVMVENNPEAWIAGISTLIEDALLRGTIATEARKTVAEKFDINTQYKLWVDAFQSLMPGELDAAA